MIRKTNEEYEQFHNFMKDLFDRVYLPIHKRNEHMPKDLSQDDIAYKEKVKAYTSYKIGRKISKNNLLYTEEEIEDGIFFVKSTGVLRIITKWV